MKRQLSWRFHNEERFSDYIEKFQLDKISKIIGKTFLKSTSIREKKAEFDDHDGTLRVDIRVETINGEYVIIENQYNKTNHDHFGKLFTYATMLSSQNKSVTDAIWIVEKVREEHYQAVNMINDLLIRHGINFKIWLLVASLTESGLDLKIKDDVKTVNLRFPQKQDFFLRGLKDYDDPEHKAELDEFMPMLMEHISEELPSWNSPKRALSTPHCIGVTSNKTEPYDFNIPFRVKAKYIKVEARFTDDFYKKWINDNWEMIVEKASCSIDFFIEAYQQYFIEYEVNKSYIKISGRVKADITNEGKWSYYIDQTLQLIKILRELCEKIEKY